MSSLPVLTAVACKSYSVYYFPIFLLDSHDKLNRKWTSFQERNLLCKMDLVLNVFSESPELIQSASNEHLKEIADSADSKINKGHGSKQFKINIPPIEEDFPDISTKKTKIFPLPISHENQCKTVGVASNLDLFKNEFGFESHKKSKFMPLKSCGREFDLNKAYGRFEFLKSLEQHRKQQRQYENVLRGDVEKLGECTYEKEPAEVLITVEEDSSSHCLFYTVNLRL